MAWRVALVALPAALWAQQAPPRNDAARSWDAERRLALQDMAAGRVVSAVAHLERARAFMERAGRDDAAVLTSLALAYGRLGQTDAFAVVADRALRAGAAGADADAIRERLARLKAEQGVMSAERAVPVGDPGEMAQRDSSWRAYRSGQFAVSARAFGQLANTAVSPLRRGEARLMAAQSLLEAGAADSAHAWFARASDSTRVNLASVDARFDSTVSVPARAIVATRAFDLLYGDAATSGRLLVANPDTVRALAGSPALHVATSADLANVERALGAPVADRGARAAARLPFSKDGAPRVRDAAIALREADARVARAQQVLDDARREQSTRTAAADLLVRDATAMRDSLTLLDEQARTLAAMSLERDSSIAVTVRRYRVTLLEKIGAVRDLARANARRVDSLASASRQLTPEAATVVRNEMTTVQGYLSIAGAAEAALDSGLVRQPVLVRRDSLHVRLAALQAGIAAQRLAQDSTRGAAVAAAARVRADWTERERAFTTAQAAAMVSRDSVERSAAQVVADELRLRVQVWRTTLAREQEAAEFGGASARFFAAIAEGATAATRDAAVADLTAVAARYPQGALRPRALIQVGELLTRRADAEYSVAQRAGTGADRPDYTAPMARLEEFLSLYPADAEADAAAYTLGTLAFGSQRWDDASRAYERVIADEHSRYRPEAFYRLGETRFEMAIRAAGDTRRALLAQASTAYDKAIGMAATDGDIHYLAMYKLGWSSYVQAERQSSEEYRRAVDTFARLVAEYDRLSHDRQSRLALRDEAIDYMAIALTQIGGANDAIQYLSSLPDLDTRLLVLRRTARALREQGEFASAALAFRAVVEQAPLDTAAIGTQGELVDLYQNRMLEQERAQQARLQLVDAYAPSSPWGRANVARAASAAAVREHMLRDASQYELSRAAKGGRPVYVSAAELLARYQREFAQSDSSPRMNALYAEALFGAGEFAKAGAEYSRTAARGDTLMATAARRNAIVAYDSAFTRTPNDRVVQDSLFAATERFAALAGDADARAVTVSKGRHASEAARWDVMASAFEGFAQRWPSDVFAPDARKLVGDARFRMGQYSRAQVEWSAAQRMALTANRKALADSISGARIGAAARVADSLVKAGQYARAADSVYVPLAQDIGDPTRAGDALRNAIEVHLMDDSTSRLRGDTAASQAARRRAAESIALLARDHPAYQHTFTYRTVRARLLSDLGDAAGAVAALKELTAANPAWPGRADAMVRTAVLLDSLGRRAEAAAAYEQMSVAYPQDRRAADASYNAAVTYGDAKDATNAARAAAAFIQRFPRDARVADAQKLRLDQLSAAGDSTTAAAELGRLCARPSGALADRCATRAAEAAYREGMALWPRYEAMKLVIATRADLTRAGVEKASAPKQQLLRQLGQTFGRAIATGAPEWLSASSFQTGMAQWHYALFLRDVQLPAELSEAQQLAAQKGSAVQAQQYFDAARTTWQALVDKAAQGKFENGWVTKAKDALEGKGVPERGVVPQ